jgi:hypothetical protein
MTQLGLLPALAPALAQLSSPQSPRGPFPTNTTLLSCRPISANTKPYILVCDKSLFNCLEEEIH